MSPFFRTFLHFIISFRFFGERRDNQYRGGNRGSTTRRVPGKSTVVEGEGRREGEGRKPMVTGRVRIAVAAAAAGQTEAKMMAKGERNGDETAKGVAPHILLISVSIVVSVGRPSPRAASR